MHNTITMSLRGETYRLPPSFLLVLGIAQDVTVQGFNRTFKDCRNSCGFQTNLKPPKYFYPQASVDIGNGNNVATYTY